MSLLVKEKQNSHDRQATIDKIEAEYNIFKQEILSMNAEEIFNACNKIRFYESVMEYFRYNTIAVDMVVKICENSDSLLQELWQLYLKYENLQIESWSDIANMLVCYLVRRDK